MKHIAPAIASLGLLLAALPAPLAAGQATAQATDPSPAAAAAAAPVAFGMDAASMSAQSKAGVAPDYATFWVGPWTLKSGWGGPDGQLEAMKAAGVTPAIHYYYWGDDISRSCVEDGCWSNLHGAYKDRVHWDLLGEQLIDHLNARMGGRPVVVFLETEFNKGDVATYEPLDAYLAAKAQRIREGYPAAQVVMALGNWGSAAWGTWDRFAAASDYAGIQGMRGSTRQGLSDYGTLYEGLAAGADRLHALFGKPIFFQDIALSSHPEPDWLQPQADALKEVFDHLPDLKADGLAAVIYRSWLDSPGMDTANYYGEAERHWGLAWAGSGAHKPAAQAWIDGVRAERSGATPAPPPPPPPPAPAAADGTAAEVESFSTKTAGGRQSDPQASGGAMWNLWSNGAVAQAYDASAPLDLVVRARGTLLGGVAPHMEVTVDGVRVLSADPGTAYRDYAARLPAAGRQEVRIAFTNDARSSAEDRNLVLDTVSFRAPNAPPAAAFTASAADLSVAVDASGSSDPDGDALSYAWSFGDGATTTGVQASHTYAAAGTYTVSLAVGDGEAEATASREVVATQPNRAPAAAFTAAVDDLAAAFDASASSDPDCDALSYAWSFGDGATAAGVQASHAYAAGGTYTATLTVSDGALSASRSQAVAVRAPFTATFSVSAGSNEWWQEVKATASAPVAQVEYQADGGAWRPMALKSWGNWAANDHVAKGTMVSFRATDASGRTAASQPQPWLGMAPAPSTTTTTTSSPAFKAAFTPKAVGNDWWVETAVSANQPVAKVEARLDGGAWIQLPKDSWGTYAKGVHAPNGTWVTFRATDASGATAASAAVKWT